MPMEANSQHNEVGGSRQNQRAYFHPAIERRHDGPRDTMHPTVHHSLVKVFADTFCWK
jgi:hypothetical protein